MAMGGDHYWVLAHVTPTFDESGKIAGYHSNRRKPEKSQIEKVTALYRSLRDIEDRAADKKIGMEQSLAHLNSQLKARGIGYDEFVFSL